jgi:hypothetical protein
MNEEPTNVNDGSETKPFVPPTGSGLYKRTGLQPPSLPVKGLKESASSHADEPPLGPDPGLRELFDALLRSPQHLAEGFETTNFTNVFLKLLGIAMVSLLTFGFVLGCFSRNDQLWAAPVKVLGGMLFAALICFPSLYVFSTLARARFSPKSMLLSLTGAVALGGMLLLGLAPALWIFVESTSSFGFMGFLCVLAWVVSLFFALRFIKSCTRSAGAVSHGPVLVWSILFVLVTLQLSTTLRPLLGESEQFLQLGEKRFFLEHWTLTAGMQLKSDQVEKPEATINNERGRGEYDTENQ